MTEKPPTEEQRIRRRWINLGEIVAVGGLIISGLALWNSWRGGRDEPAPAIVEKAPESIPLALRGQVRDEGRALALAPIESGHALEGLTIAARPPAAGSASFGSEPLLSASLVESWLPDDVKREGVGTLPLQIEARYIEQGEDRVARQQYGLSYGWVDGGLFSGRSLRITGLRRG